MKIAAFNHMINSGSQKLTLVDFYADWCGPCQTVSPIVQQVARELSHKINLVKVNVDKSRPVAEKFNIKSIPTLLLMDGNKIIWKKTGYVTKKELKAKLSTN
jgi:thioredoxin 1